MKRKRCAEEKAAAGPKAVQRGRLRSAALSVWFFALFFRAVFSRRGLGCGARQRAALVYAKLTPRCQIGFSVPKSLKIIFRNLLYEYINSCVFVEKRV